jgi:hypothetical protein
MMVQATETCSGNEANTTDHTTDILHAFKQFYNIRINLLRNCVHSPNTLLLKDTIILGKHATYLTESAGHFAAINTVIHKMQCTVKTVLCLNPSICNTSNFLQHYFMQLFLFLIRLTLYTYDVMSLNKKLSLKELFLHNRYN